MNHSIVRWLTVPDTWDFTDDIKPDAENPKRIELLVLLRYLYGMKIQIHGNMIM